jgi:TonB family protein
VLVLAFLLIFATQGIDANNRIVVQPPKIGITELLPVPEIYQEQPIQEEFLPQPIIEKSNEILGSGPEEFAAEEFNIVDDELLEDEIVEFATLDKLGRASASGGEVIDDGLLSSGIEFQDQPEATEVLEIAKEIEPDPTDFIAVEKEPGVDLKKLQNMVVYPNLARRANVEGLVILRVLVAKTGHVKRILIEYSENELLNQAAIEAVNNYGKFTPAIQNNESIMCWVNIPIRFKLR